MVVHHEDSSNKYSNCVLYESLWLVMDDALDCELVDVKGLFSFPKTNMGTASNKYALENE